ncbi:uncharacterized protein LOC108825191 [Raphanus sativus]|uniref:Uncharacterized protein LOC108825191 n=1 Tax=Raphanus sativus TaxID=3726 RepID=A0A9W3CG23_RAPSA|nr:uncharacterized protein LOC108825191 [Raphanus sativus]
MKLKLIEPLKLLSKDEICELGRILNVPVGFLKRHPFPCPGLAVKVLGNLTQGNALESYILRLMRAFAVFLPVRSVEVQGDRRTHSHVVALRAVTSQDRMTADWFNFEHKPRKICNSLLQRSNGNKIIRSIWKFWCMDVCNSSTM